MKEIINKIMKILGNFDGSQLSINFTHDEIWINVYGDTIAIVIDIKDRYCYLDCETSNYHLTKDMMSELTQIMEIIEENIDEFIGCIQ